MHDRSLYAIGEFSKITGLTVKALRFYDEQGVLAPSAIDAETGYRYYDENKIETARVIRELRNLEGPGVNRVRESHVAVRENVDR